MTTEQDVLLRLAREAIERWFRREDVRLPAAAFLQAPAAVFVTLRQRPGGALRGCVGSIEAHLPLGHAVVAAARSAAFADPRFPPLSGAQLEWVRVEVSVLSPLRLLPVANEVEAVQELERTKPGVLLRCAHRQGVLLPKVWESVGDGAEFLRHLKLKAGLPVAFWSEAIELHLFTSEEFAEADERATPAVTS